MPIWFCTNLYDFINYNICGVTCGQSGECWLELDKVQKYISQGKWIDLAGAIESIPDENDITEITPKIPILMTKIEIYGRNKVGNTKE